MAQASHYLILNTKYNVMNEMLHRYDKESENYEW